jgi:O-antigen/teichoic acid export membrane protein
MLFRYTDRWMLNYFLGLEEVGIYSVAMNVTGLVFMFGIIVGNVLMPTLSFLWEEGNKEKALSILDFSIRSSTLLLLGGAVILMVFRNQIIGLLYGAEYARSSAIIGVLLIFWLLNTIYWIVGAYAGLIEKTYIPLASNAVGLACNIILNYIFIPKYGLMGAAAATTIAFEVTLVTIIVWSWIKGFCMSANTIFLCLIPLIFLLKDLVIIIIYLLLVGILFATELLMTKDERKKLFRHLFDAVRKYKGAG